MLVRRLLPLGVPLHHRRIRDLQLGGHVLQSRPRHIEGILGQEMPQEPHCSDLQPKAELVMISALVRDQIQRGAVEQEEPLQFRTAQLTDEPLVRGHLTIRQELNGHSATTYVDSIRCGRPHAKIIPTANRCTDLPQPRTSAPGPGRVRTRRPHRTRYGTPHARHRGPPTCRTTGRRANTRAAFVHARRAGDLRLIGRVLNNLGGLRNAKRLPGTQPARHRCQLVITKGSSSHRPAPAPRARRSDPRGVIPF
jgi:hypothetical protein